GLRPDGARRSRAANSSPLLSADPRRGGQVPGKTGGGNAMATSGFQFVTASYVIRINNQKATTLNELRTGLDQASDASIFFHTFQSLGRHHFLTEGFSNELAQWVLTGLNRPQLAERLGGLDVRDYLSLAELR